MSNSVLKRKRNSACISADKEGKRKRNRSRSEVKSFQRQLKKDLREKDLLLEQVNWHFQKVNNGRGNGNGLDLEKTIGGKQGRRKANIQIEDKESFKKLRKALEKAQIEMKAKDAQVNELKGDLNAKSERLGRLNRDLKTKEEFIKELKLDLQFKELRCKQIFKVRYDFEEAKKATEKAEAEIEELKKVVARYEAAIEIRDFFSISHEQKNWNWRLKRKIERYRDCRLIRTHSLSDQDTL